MPYTIKPLLLSKSKVSKGQMTYFVDWEKEIWTATIIWYIKAGDKNVLVDTGITAADMQKYLYGRPFEEVMTFEQALGSVGITPEQVDIVIQTHLHFDHCGHTPLCRNAKVVVQEEELKFAYSPHALFAGSYNLNFLKDVSFRVVSGDAEILPGIKVIYAPGHTPGTQAVAVETARGTAIISGFCCIKENFFPPEKMRTRWPVIAPGVSSNSLQAFDTALKLKSSADIIIAQHDMEYAEVKEIP
jgi:glyoxylase-like metal-dependent hydrolase (beta-lactamase superfamily II)